MDENIATPILVLISGSGCIANEINDIRPADNPVKHTFQNFDDEPMHRKSRRFQPRNIQIVREGLDKMLRAGFKTPESSAWSFTVLISTKKDGKPHFWVEYWRLNKNMSAD